MTTLIKNGHIVDPSHDISGDMDIVVSGQRIEGVYTRGKSPECEKTMMVSTSWYPSREAFKADCLNGDEDGHDWQNYTDVVWTANDPILHKARKCANCGKVERLDNDK